MESMERGQICPDHSLVTPLFKDTRSRCGQTEAGWKAVQDIIKGLCTKFQNWGLERTLEGSSNIGRAWQVGLSFA